ncbi:MAG: hypothetical protein HQ567_08730 [Candidatus Nealsonbacteria bacterium]|nr:hypothetical protein [Candidatus Nealsonbacteria bacterium]
MKILSIILAIHVMLAQSVFGDEPDGSPPASVVLDARAAGVVGDGSTDDGPAIQRAVAQLCRQEQPAILRFESNRVYRVKNVAGIRLFRLENCRDITIDGGGSTFLLDGGVRFALLQGARNVQLKNFSLDYDPLPFVDGLIVAKNAERRYVDVRVFKQFTMPPLGGPTREGGEQAYFGMLWIEGPHSLIGHHFYVLDMQPASPDGLGERTVRVFTDFQRFDRIQQNAHAISLPVCGVAHRCMDGATIRIARCENVEVENVNIWSAPWFAFQVFANRGALLFRHVDIRPKPGTGRRTSSWRDGFHVKGNRASLLFESCHLEGMNDDAFNISTHMSRVIRVISPTEVQVRQVYPLELVPFETGDDVTFYSVSDGRIAGTAELRQCDGVQRTEYLDDGRPHAPLLTLHLATAIDGLRPGDRLWNVTSANPNTVLRDCTVYNSCRFQSPLTIEQCQLTAFCWFHSENVEGPIPSCVVIKDSVLRLGRGNPLLAASLDGSIAMPNRSPDDPSHATIGHVLLQGNTIDGQVRFARIKQLELHNNRFLAPRSELHFADCEDVLLQDNHLDSRRIVDLKQLSIEDAATRAAVRISNKR